MQLEKTDLLALLKWTNLTTTTIPQILCVQSYSESLGSRMDLAHCWVALSGCPEPRTRTDYLPDCKPRQAPGLGDNLTAPQGRVQMFSPATLPGITGKLQDLSLYFLHLIHPPSGQLKLTRIFPPRPKPLETSSGPKTRLQQGL